MTHQQALDYLRSLGNEVLNMDLGLDRMRHLVEAMGSPHRAFPSILVAGTNGKGSVARYAQAILSTSLGRVGLYTSPHIRSLEERYRVGDERIPEADFAAAMGGVLDALDAGSVPGRPTYFETLTAIAFDWFARRQVDVAVLEIGMGGRLDSTNVVAPSLSVLTPIGLDHQRYLGETLGEITREKAGILRPGVPAVSSPQTPGVRAVLEREASRSGTVVEFLRLDEAPVADAGGRYAARWKGIRIAPGALGQHQVFNAALAAMAARCFLEVSRASRIVHSNRPDGDGPFPGSEDTKSKGTGKAAIFGRTADSRDVEGAISRTILPGSVERVRENPLVILDGGHNPDAARNLAAYLEVHSRRPRTLVVGMMADKDIAAFGSILSPLFDRVLAVSLPPPRGASTDALLRGFPGGVPRCSVEEALGDALASDAATIVATGSFSLLAPVAAALG